MIRLLLLIVWKWIRYLMKSFDSFTRITSRWLNGVSRRQTRATNWSKSSIQSSISVDSFHSFTQSSPQLLNGPSLAQKYESISSPSVNEDRIVALWLCPASYWSQHQRNYGQLISRQMTLKSAVAFNEPRRWSIRAKREEGLKQKINRHINKWINEPNNLKKKKN